MKYFKWKDKSGRGETASKVTLTNVLKSEDETNWDGDSLHEWAENAEPGDEWESRTEKYTCTHEDKKQLGSNMTNGNFTIAFLKSIDKRTKNEILSNIAKHYGITNEEAYEEVTDKDAENLLDYVTGPTRAATSVLVQKFKIKHSTLGKTSNMTITASNYFEQVDTFISKLPAAVKEAHDLVTSLKNDGIENPFDTGDKDIDEVGSKLLEQANKVLQSTGPTAKPSAKKSKASKKRNTDILKKYMFDERHPLMLIDKGTSQWNEAYDEFVEYIKLNPQGKPGEFELITKPAPKKSVKSVAKKRVQTSQTTSNKKQGLKSKSYKATSNKSNSFKQKSKSAAKKSMPVKKAKRMAQKVATKAVKQARKADAKKAPVTVKKLSLELQLIKQVTGMAGKTYTIDALRKKALTIKNHMAEGRIHDHVTTIKQLLTAFNKLIDTAVDMKADKVKVTISKGKQTELSALVKNATVRVRTEFLAGAGDKVVLTFLRVDPDTGNIIYRGSDKDNYVSVEGTIHDMTDEGEPLTPVKNVIIKEGEPVYDPKDRFARRLTNLSGPKKPQRKSVKSVAKKRTAKKA